MLMCIILLINYSLYLSNRYVCVFPIFNIYDYYFMLYIYLNSARLAMLSLRCALYYIYIYIYI